MSPIDRKTDINNQRPDEKHKRIRLRLFFRGWDRKSKHGGVAFNLIPGEFSQHSEKKRPASNPLKK